MTEEQENPPVEADAAAVTEPAAEVITEPEAIDELAALRQELEQVRAREAEYLDGWQRARAELANARKRFQRDQEQAYNNAVGQVLARLLPVVDDFERAIETLPQNLSSLTWIEGVLLIYRKLQWILEQEHVAPIEAVAKPFDPFAHQAVTHEPSDTVPEGHVISEVQKGYTLGDRVLRPALVRVSSGPPSRPEGAEPESHEQPTPAEVPEGEPAGDESS